MKIAIVNDLFIAVELLRRVIKQEPELDVCWVAENGEVAIEKCKKIKPDLILMDLIMPVMNGVEATKIIMQKTPCPILVVTATVAGNSAMVFDAMSCGALDAVNTPYFNKKNEIEGAEDLLHKIEIIGKLSNCNFKRKKVPDSGLNVSEIILIGASTGGPGIISKILLNIRIENKAVVIVQHVDEKFAQSFCDWLSQLTKLKVIIAEDGMSIKPNQVYVAGKNKNLLLDVNCHFKYTDETASTVYTPSVDILFASFADNYPKNGKAVLLTGMGSDGASGLLNLKRKGWLTIAQDKESSIVYGMPKAAVENNSAMMSLSPKEIIDELNRF
jgi:two-component system response regulator WspF